MHYGEYKGAAAAAQPKRILILGESHHGDGPEDVGKPGKFPTEKVVKDYLSEKDGTEQRLQFFHKIALSFGIDTGMDKDTEEKLFWSKVCFGNYVNDLCGVGDATARRQVEDHRAAYNQDLAAFVNQRQIDSIFCFSVLAYWALPVSGGGRKGILSDGQGGWLNQKTVAQERNQNVYLRGYVCQPMPGLFDHPVKIYGIPHPSARGGFDPEHFAAYLKPIFEDCCG